MGDADNPLIPFPPNDHWDRTVLSGFFELKRGSPETLLERVGKAANAIVNVFSTAVTGYSTIHSEAPVFTNEILVSAAAENVVNISDKRAAVKEGLVQLTVDTEVKLANLLENTKSDLLKVLPLKLIGSFFPRFFDGLQYSRLIPEFAMDLVFDRQNIDTAVNYLA